MLDPVHRPPEAYRSRTRFDSSSIEYDFDADKLLEDITRHSLALARKVGYDNVGTWEWIVTKDGSPFLMEVNTRIQVENGVSARISKVKGQGDVDIIAEQIRIGLGEPLGYTQEDITFEGVGIEYRLIAEDPDNRFTPWVGRIDAFGWPSHPLAQDAHARAHGRVVRNPHGIRPEPRACHSLGLKTSNRPRNVVCSSSTS